MIFIFGVCLFLLCGYAIAILLDLLRNDLLSDLSLAWFFGIGYYGLGLLINHYVFHGKLGPVSSLLVLSIPFLLAFIRQIKNLSAKKIELKEGRYLSDKKNRKLTLLEKGLLLISLSIFLLICSHGVSTPVVSDDAARVRAYYPIMVYKQDLKYFYGKMFTNGPVSNYAPQLLWQLNGGVEYFFIKYMNLVSFACFLILLFRIPVKHGNVGEGVYNVFLTLSLPFLVYHATSANLDLPVVIPFALGFLLFSIYVESGKRADLNTAILIFTVAALIKGKGELLAVTGIGIAGMYVLSESARKKSPMPWKSISFILPLAIFLYLKESVGTPYFKRFDEPVNSLTNLIVGSPSKVEATAHVFAPGQKIYGFFHSLFLSGHFNILFYLLVGSILFFAGRIAVSKRLKWNLFFFAVVFSECYIYMASRFDVALAHQSIIHRVMILLAVIGVLLLSSIWGSREKRSNFS